MCTHTRDSARSSSKMGLEAARALASPGTHTARNHCSHTSAAGQLEGSAGPVQVPWQTAQLGSCCPQALPARGPRGPAGGRWQWRLGTGGGGVCRATPSRRSGQSCELNGPWGGQYKGRQKDRQELGHTEMTDQGRSVQIMLKAAGRH